MTATFADNSAMTIANHVSTNNYVVAARKIYSRLSLKVFPIKQVAIFDNYVMSLVELDQVQSIIVLQGIVIRSAAIRRTVVVNLRIANGDVAGPKGAIVPGC